MGPSRRIAAAALVLVLAAGAGLGTYLVADGRAREKPTAGRAAPPVPVRVARAVREDFPVTVKAIGNVEPFATVAIRARVDGQIMDVNVRDGASVSRGEVLFRIDPRPYEAALRQAQANALRDAAARDQARSQERRYLDLLEKNFVSKEAYAQIRTNAATAEATLRASQAALENARLNLEYCTIRAPISGFAGKVLLQAGNMARASDSTPLVVINQVKPIYVSFAIPEQQLSEVRERMRQGKLAVDVLDDAQRRLAHGVLGFIDNTVDPSTGTIRLRGEFENADAALWPGQFVKVSLHLHDEQGVLVIPSQAVQTGPEGRYVYVVRDNMTVEVRPVVVSSTDSSRAVIASGLAGGERVVTEGQLRLGPDAHVQIARAAAADS